MTLPDAMGVLQAKVQELGQAETARRLNVSPSAVNQLLHNKYRASADNILQKVLEVFGEIVVECPVLGQIELARCAEERNKPFAASNHLRVRLYRTCRKCTVHQSFNNSGGK